MLEILIAKLENDVPIDGAYTHTHPYRHANFVFKCCQKKFKKGKPLHKGPFKFTQ